MSGDKDIENHLPGSEETEAGEDNADFPQEMDHDSGEDFAEGDFGEGDDLVEEDWEAYEDEGYMEEDGEIDEEAAARSKSFNKIVIGIACVIALAVGGYQIFSSQPAQSPVATGETPYKTAEFSKGSEEAPPAPYGISYGKPVPEEQAPVQKAPEPGLINNPDSFRNISRGETVTYENVPSTQQEAPPQPYAAPELTDEQPPMPSPITRSQTAQEGAQEEGATGLIPMPETAQETPDDAGEESFAGYRETGSPQQEASPFNGRGTTAASNRTESAPSSASASDINGAALTAEMAQKLDTIIDRLDSMEDNLDRIDNRQATLESRIASLEKQPRRSETRTPAARSSAPSGTDTGTVSSRRNTAGEETGAVQWVLRSAQPGQAMVSRAGQNDMMTVSVGDNLSGIGRITDISLQDGRWVVQGTNNKITQ